MRRYNILDGDTTNARGGGAVIGSATDCTNNGHALALIGDDVICRECGKVGKISPNGPRLRETVHGRDVALSGDLCICDCEPPPQLIHSRTDMYQEIDTDEVIRQGYGSWVGKASPTRSLEPTKAQPPIQRYAQRFHVWDSSTGKSFAHQLYISEADGGAQEFGYTDANGIAIIETDAPKSFRIHIVFAAPKRELKPSQGA